MATPLMLRENPDAILHLSLFKLQQLQVRASRGVSPKLLRNVLLANVLNRALTVVSRAAPPASVVPTSSVRSSGRSSPMSSAKTSAVTEGLSGLTLEQRGGQCTSEPVGNGIRASAELDIDCPSDVLTDDCTLHNQQLFDCTDSGVSSDEENSIDNVMAPSILDTENELLPTQPEAPATRDSTPLNGDVNASGCPSRRERKRSRSELEEETSVCLSAEGTKKARLEDGLSASLWYEEERGDGDLADCAAEPVNLDEFSWSLGPFAFSGLSENGEEELGIALPSVL